ncbi:MAG: hypothetical protein H0X26_08090 [Alphaproteobacteria bacterium]|nr:hypothetical protein [Alphaproteobacteria bacterium]
MFKINFFGLLSAFALSSTPLFAMEAYPISEKENRAVGIAKKNQPVTFQSTEQINNAWGKHMLAGCYHNFKAEDSSDHTHPGAITLNFPSEFEPNARNDAQIKINISINNFVNEDKIKPLLATLDTVYLEYIEMKTLQTQRTYENALALLKPNGKLYFDHYMLYVFDDAIKEPQFFPFSANVKDPVGDSSKQDEFRLKAISALKNELENEYKLDIQSFQAFKGVNPFNKRRNSTLIMIEKTGQSVVANRDVDFQKQVRELKSDILSAGGQGAQKQYAMDLECFAADFPHSKEYLAALRTARSELGID